MHGLLIVPTVEARARLLSGLETIASAAAPVRSPLLRQFLSRSITSGMFVDPFVSARLVAAACAVADLPLATLVFRSNLFPTAFAYNSLIRAYSDAGDPPFSFLLFRCMLRQGLYPDRFSLPFLLRNAASSVASLHALSVTHGLAHDPHIATSFVCAYADSGAFELAMKLFDEMPKRTAVTWSAAISRCSRFPARECEGLSLFSETIGQWELTSVESVIGALSCCLGLGLVIHTKAVHAVALRQLAGISTELETTLVSSYAKCGCLKYSTTVFESMDNRDGSAWTAMIAGLAMHGRGEEAVTLFHRMVEEQGILPDSLAFTAVLHACSHSGMVDAGVQVFNEMPDKYGVPPRMEHYGAVVDLLCRAGRFNDVERVVRSMPSKPNQVVWATLFRACVIADAKLGSLKKAEQQLPTSFSTCRFGFDAGVSGFYVGLSNAYALKGMWEDVVRVRDEMVACGTTKEKGFSLVEVEGKAHKFLVGDASHPLTVEIYKVLYGISEKIMYNNCLV